MMTDAPLSLAPDRLPTPEAKCGKCFLVLEAGRQYRVQGTSSLLCVHCAVDETFKGKYLVEQFWEKLCPICLEEKPTVHFTCVTGGPAPIGHSFCKPCALGINPITSDEGDDEQDWVEDDDDDDDDYEDHDENHDENDGEEEERLTEIKGDLRLLLPDLPKRKQLLCPICRGLIVHAINEPLVLEGSLVTDSTSSDNAFIIPQGAIVVDLTVSGSEKEASNGSRKRKRSVESSIEEGRKRMA